MKIAVFGRTASDENCQALQTLCRLMADHQLDVLVYDEFLQQVQQQGTTITCEYKTFRNKEDLQTADFVLSIGGDGTLLNTVDFVLDSGVPVIGVNTGRLGFLANFTVEQLPRIISLMKDEGFRSDQRSLLEVSCDQPLFKKPQFALNEFTIQKQDPSAIIKVHAHLNGEFLSSYWSDGVIVSTPTGSTGYSLSANGPIIVPGSSSIVITPIAPHNFNLRPIVLPNNSTLELSIGAHRGKSYCTVDSKHWEIGNDFVFEIKKANFAFNIVRPPENTFIDTLRSKLMWGIDNRNKE